jgi:hypothetical protein
MNFSEALAKVLSISHRPDKVVSATDAINEAISYCTLLGEFRRDLVEASIAISGTSYGATISISSLTRFRKFKYVKPAGAYYYLTQISPEHLFTPGYYVQSNTYYVAGTNMTYVISAAATSLEVAYYSRALTLDAVTNTTHWMLDEIPLCIIKLATAKIFAEIGDDSSAARYERDGMDMFKAYRRDQSTAD